MYHKSWLSTSILRKILRTFFTTARKLCYTVLDKGNALHCVPCLSGSPQLKICRKGAVNATRHVRECFLACEIILV